MGSSRSSDVIVIGAGVIGAACALALARREMTVTVLESSPSWGMGCSRASAGLIVPSHSTPIASPSVLREGLVSLARRRDEVALRLRPTTIPWALRYALASTPWVSNASRKILHELSQRSLMRYRSLEADGVEMNLRHEGVIAAYETESSLNEARSAQDGLEAFEVLGRPDIEAEVPGLTGACGGLLFSGEAHGDPLVIARGLGEAAISAGAEFHPNSSVLSVEAGARGVNVTTRAARFHCGHVVVATGAERAHQIACAGKRSALIPGVGHSYEVEMEHGLRRPVLLADRHVVLTPLGGRLRIAGGLWLGGMGSRRSGRRIASVAATAERAFPAIRGVSRRASVTGTRACTPDGLPLVGVSGVNERVLTATGHAMLGITLAPVTGDLIAGLVAGDPRADVLDALDPRRFSGARLGLRSVSESRA